MGLRSNLSTLAEALKRVSNEYRSIAARETSGDKAYTVIVVGGEVDRRQSDAIFQHIIKHNRIEHEPVQERDEKLERERVFRLEVQAVRMHDGLHAARNITEIVQDAAHSAGVPLDELVISVFPRDSE